MYQQPFYSNQNTPFYNQPPYNNTHYPYPHHQSINYPRILENTHKTLRTINQILPLINQVGPLIQNASIMFKVSKAIKNIPNINYETSNNEIQYIEPNLPTPPTNPTFFS